MPVELMPPRAQALWGRRAVANFALGGLGTGAYVTAVLVSGFGPSPAVGAASWLGPVLVLAGFALVASEAGRPLRGARVLARVRTSWMSRELAAGGAFVLLALGEPAFGSPWQRRLAAAAALATAVSQGFILRRARGVAAWSVPAMPLLFLVSALVSGAGLLTLAELASGRRPAAALLRALLVLLVLDALAWTALVLRRGDQAFVASTRELRAGATWTAVVGGGHALPFLLLLIAQSLPGGAEHAAALAAALTIGGQVCAKAALILIAGRLRPITIPHLRLQRGLS